MEYLIFSLFVFICLFNHTLYATEVSFTIDDPGVQSTSTMSHVEIAKKILQTIKENELEVIIFTCSKRIDGSEGMKLLKLWDGQGHILANHSLSNLNYNSENVDFNFMSQDILKNESIIKYLEIKG